MFSSTSSSRTTGLVSAGLRATVAAAARILAAFGPSLAAAGLVLAGLIVVSQHLPSQEGERGLEAIIVREQIRRARTVRPDLLIVGDSSALMGVDPRLLSRSLHLNVQSLATLGWVGPAGYGQFVRAVSRTSGPPKAVLLLMCGFGLRVDEPTFVQAGYEAAVLDKLGSAGVTADDRPQDAAPTSLQAPGLRSVRRALSSMRERVYTRTFMLFLSPPLPGRLGFYYGWPEDIARVLDSERGSLVDPTLTDLTTISEPFQFEISDAVQQRFPAFSRAARQSGVTTVWFGLTPVPENAIGRGTLASRTEAVSRCLHLMQLPAAAELPGPASLPPASFATFSHLAALGRQQYSEILAGLLRARLASSTAP